MSRRSTIKRRVVVKRKLQRMDACKSDWFDALALAPHQKLLSAKHIEDEAYQKELETQKQLVVCVARKSRAAYNKIAKTLQSSMPHLMWPSKLDCLGSWAIDIPPDMHQQSSGDLLAHLQEVTRPLDQIFPILVLRD